MPTKGKMENLWSGLTTASPVDRHRDHHSHQATISTISLEFIETTRKPTGQDKYISF